MAVNTLARMTAQQRFKLGSALAQRRQWLEDERPSYDDVSAVLRDEVGFQPNASDLKYCARMADIPWKPRRKAGPNVIRPMAVQQQRLAALEAAVRHLYSVAGVALPQELQPADRNGAT